MLSWEGAASYDLPQMNSTSRLMNSRSIFSHCALTLRKCHLFIGKFYLLKQQQKPNNWKGNSDLIHPLLSKRPFQSVPLAFMSLTAETPWPLPRTMLVMLLRQDWAARPGEPVGTSPLLAGHLAWHCLCSSGSHAAPHVVCQAEALVAERVRLKDGRQVSTHINSSQVGAAACSADGRRGCLHHSAGRKAAISAPPVSCCGCRSDPDPRCFTHWWLWVSALPLWAML